MCNLETKTWCIIFSLQDRVYNNVNIPDSALSLSSFLFSPPFPSLPSSLYVCISNKPCLSDTLTLLLSYSLSLSPFLFIYLSVYRFTALHLSRTVLPLPHPSLSFIYSLPLCPLTPHLAPPYLLASTLPHTETEKKCHHTHKLIFSAPLIFPNTITGYGTPGTGRDWSNCYDLSPEAAPATPPLVSSKHVD